MLGMIKKHKWILIGAGGVLIAGVICLIAFGGSGSAGGTQTYKETTVEYGTLTAGVTENGTLAVTENSQEFELDLGTSSTTASSPSASASASASSSSSAGGMQQGAQMGGLGSMGGIVSTTTTTSEATLEVSEVLVAVGQKVEEGDALLKLTDESVAAARKELEKTIDSAALALSDAQIQRDIAVMQAEYDYKANLALKSTAKSDYNATLNSLSAAVTNAQRDVDDKNDEISSLTAQIEDFEARIAAGETGLDAQLSAKKTELTKAKSELSNLKAKLTLAKNQKTTDSITAKQDYETSVLTYENAQTIYDMALSGVDDDVEDAEEALATAKENLEDFEAYVKDGSVKAEYGGIVTTVGYSAGDSLSSSTAIAAYIDSVSLVVTVSEEDIYAVNVGDAVTIELLAYEGETFAGEVAQIDTTSTSSSTVSYSVTVDIEDASGKLYAGMTGYVTFITKQMEDVLFVSNKAVTQEGTRSFLLIRKEDGTTEKRQVTTGFSDGVNVEIKEGATQGETVLIESKVTQG